MKHIMVKATWRSSHTIEVPDNYNPEDPAQVIKDYGDQIDTSCAELVDWDWWNIGE